MSQTAHVEDRDALGVGVNLARGRMRWSVFGNLVWIESPTARRYDSSADLTFRAVATF